MAKEKKEKEIEEKIEDKKEDVIEENKEVQKENNIDKTKISEQISLPPEQIEQQTKDSERGWKDKQTLYFDSQVRMKKSYACLAFMFAANQSFESLKSKPRYKDLPKKDTVEETVLIDQNDSQKIKQLKEKFKKEYDEKLLYRLKNAFNLFREDLQGKEDGSGTFGKDLPNISDLQKQDVYLIEEQSLNVNQKEIIKKQFNRQYTIARDFGVLSNGYHDISNLAKEVVRGNITLREYFDIIFGNCIFIIKGECRLLVYELISYLKENGIFSFSKNDITNCLGADCVDDDGLNAAMDWLSSGTFFIKKDEDTLELNQDISYDYILQRCNTKYANKPLSDVESKLNTQQKYTEYLTTSIKDVKKLNKSYYIKQGINLIYYGAPGTGKSYKINIEYPDNQYRCILYSDFEYSDFIGAIGPVINVENGKKATTYEFIPGIFTKVLKEAINNPTGVYNLIIEELNRADSCNVFGDIFQLLDREDGFSKYSICNKNIAEYIYESDRDYTDLDVDVNKNEIRIPSNLNIVCTMNTSDKNINSFDSAFIRRWKREYIKIDFVGKQLNGKDLASYEIKDFKYKGKIITWVAFAETINEYIVDSNIPNKEDKQLGPYFIKPETLDTPESFANDVLVYLFTDVFKFELDIIFKEKIKSINSLINNFLNNPEEVFNDDVLEKFYNYNSSNSTN